MHTRNTRGRIDIDTKYLTVPCLTTMGRTYPPSTQEDKKRTPERADDEANTESYL